MDTGEAMTREPVDTDPFSMLAFKIMDDPFVGTITFCRVYSGKVESGTTVLNSTKDKKERVGRMLLMHATTAKTSRSLCRRHRRSGWPQGHRTGDTLCDPLKPVISSAWNSPIRSSRSRSSRKPRPTRKAGHRPVEAGG